MHSDHSIEQPLHYCNHLHVLVSLMPTCIFPPPLQPQIYMAHYREVLLYLSKHIHMYLATQASIVDFCTCQDEHAYDLNYRDIQLTSILNASSVSIVFPKCTFITYFAPHGELHYGLDQQIFSKYTHVLYYTHVLCPSWCSTLCYK